MMMKTDVLVIGSSAAGLVAAVTGKTIHPDKDVTIVRMEEKTLVPCGIPYFVGSGESSDKNVMPSDQMFKDAGVNLKIGKAVSLDTENKVCTLETGETIGFDKLVLATGSTPVKPRWLKGTDLDNVFFVPKDKVYLDAMHGVMKGCKKIITIGAGFIGVEVSDELNRDGKEVTLVEKLPNVLGLAFDREVSARAEEALKQRGVTLRTGVGVKEVIGQGRVSGVLLDNGEILEADAVVLSMGYRPNVDLARDGGLGITEAGVIQVDEYMRTTVSDIFAAGDCAEKKDFVTRKPSNIMLASTACAEARCVGLNLFKLSAVKTFLGTISIFSTAIGNTCFGVAGLTEARAKTEGFDIVVGSFEGPDKHPGTLAGTNKQMVKLIAGRETGIILGGEVIGGPSTGELTNTLGFIIQNRMDINGVLTSQIGTHPLLTGSPVGYPLLKAAEIVAKKRMGLLPL
jgi:NADPH-dependent 2,4-dienoyl-CoA reductase/sulfur reductase-like enzyme